MNQLNMKNFPDHKTSTIAIIGLGYVGLPLAVEFAKSNEKNQIKNRKVIGFDINDERLAELNSGFDRTNEIGEDELNQADSLTFTNNIRDLDEANIFIVTVPTPINTDKTPDLKPIKSASVTVGKILKSKSRKGIKKSPIVIYESTVFPGATEEICIPIIEKESGLLFNESESGKGFFCGYSPERINPGDTKHTIKKIIKVTSGSTPEAAFWVDKLYKSIIDAGTHLAPSIKVAEAAKVIENTQRDINIALINELSIIFQLIGIDTLDVLNAAKTKWNFNHYVPGLVGGHCIGVDPYYLSYKCEQLGYSPKVVLAARNINDNMGNFIAEKVILEMARRKINPKESKVLILGMTFKENCPDIRNTGTIKVINSLKQFNANLTIVDKRADPNEAKKIYNISITKEIPKPNNIKFDTVICLVAHKEYKLLKKIDWKEFINETGFFIDLKGIIPRDLNPIRI